MMHRIRLRFFLFVTMILLGIFIVSFVFLYDTKNALSAQTAPDASTTAEQTTTELRRILKPTGWKLPDFYDRDVSDTDVVELEGLPIRRRLYKMTEDFDETLNFYTLQRDNSLTIYSGAVSARQVISFSRDEKTFCYKIDFVPYAVQDDGSKAFVGMILTVHYLDEDGDGVFETLHLPQPNFKLIIPDWVKKSERDNQK